MMKDYSLENYAWKSPENASKEIKYLFKQINFLAWLQDNRHWERLFFPEISYDYALHIGIEE